MAKKQGSRRKTGGTARAAKRVKRVKSKPKAAKKAAPRKAAKKVTSIKRKATKAAKSTRRVKTTVLAAASRDHAMTTSNHSGDFGIRTASAVRRVRRGEDLFRTHESHRELRAGAAEVPRDSGVGAPDDGPGSHSGGDVSPDYTGVGTGGGIAESGAGGHTEGPALSDGNGDFASGPPARGKNNLPPGLVGGSKRVEGSVVSPVDDEPHFLDDPNDLSG